MEAAPSAPRPAGPARPAEAEPGPPGPGSARPAARRARLAPGWTGASARAGLADSYAALGEFEKAIQEMKQALDADSDGSFHYRLGRWYQKTGLTHEANEAFATSSQLKENKREQERLKLALIEPQ